MRGSPSPLPDEGVGIPCALRPLSLAQRLIGITNRPILK